MTSYTDSTSPPNEGVRVLPSDQGEPARHTVSALRRWVAVATVAACLPYLLLKVAWVAGWGIGVNDPELLDASRVANVITGGLELGAIAVAVLLVVPVGRRVAPFLVAGPLWVGTGLLAMPLVGITVGALAQAATGGGYAFGGDGTLAAWVGPVVYAGFGSQALLLVAGFVLYARDRWPAVASGRAAHSGGRTQGLQDLLSGFFVVAAAGFAAVQVDWALTGGGPYDDPTTTQRVVLVAAALVALGGAAGFLGLLRGGWLTRTRLALGWVGSGVVFTNTLMIMLEKVAIEPDEWGDVRIGPGVSMLLLFVLMCGLGGATSGSDPVCRCCCCSC